MTKDVHTEHCCIRHGCKYIHWSPRYEEEIKECSVMTVTKKQSFRCEECDDELVEQGFYEMAHLMNEMYDKGFTDGHKRGSAHAQRLAVQLCGPPQ